MTVEEIRSTTGKELDENQTKAVFSEKNTVVSAGAGSGKTTVLSIRFLRLVADGKAHSDEILTLTFTRKAALEMRERILSLVSSSPLVSDEEKALLSQAQISTLDSFVSSIVRLDCERYGLTRDFSIEDDGRARAKRLATLCQRFFNDKANLKYLEALSAVYSPAQVVDSFFSFIDNRTSLVSVSSAQDIDSWLREDFRGKYEKRREECLESLSHLALDAKNEDNRTLAKALFDIIEEEGSTETVPTSFNRRSVSDDDRLYLSQYDAAIETYEALRSFLQSTGPDILQEACGAFIELVNEEKRRTSTISYCDAMDIALDILKNNAGVRNLFKSRFRYIMIDEFQDNNSKQRDLLFLLCEKKDLCSIGHVPAVDELDCSKLFFVGDEKQSIYLFRGADVSVFRSLQDEISQDGVLIDMDTNYRSRTGLIECFNEVFRNVFASSSKPFEPRFERTLYGERNEKGGSFTLLASCREDLREDNPGYSADEIEASAVASLVKRMLESDDYLVEGRRPRSDEIAILFQKTSYQVSFELALKRLGIPYQVQTNKSLMQQAVAGDFYSFLQHIVHPEDDLALAATLRGPFARISDTGVLDYLENRDEGRLDEENRKAFDRYLSLKEDIASMLFSSSIQSVISHLFYDSGYWAWLQTREDYRSFEEHYEYLCAYAKVFDSSIDGLTGFLSFLRENLGGRQKLDDVSFLHEKKEGVQIMTVHASKGLEFPIVIVASAAAAERSESDSYIFDYRGRVVASRQKGLNRLLAEDEKERQSAEEKRKLYVAMTRAKDHLVVSGTWRRKKEGLHSGNGVFFNSLLESIGFDPSTCQVSNPNVKYIPITLDSTVASSVRKRRVEELEELGRNFERHTFISKPLTSRPSDDECGEEASVPLPSFSSDGLYGEDGDEATAFGTAVHSYLEKTVEGEETSSVFLSSLFDGKRGAMIRKDLEAMAGNFLSSDLYRKIEPCRKWPEYRFFSYSEEMDTVYEGVVDLLVDLGDRMLVIDYKSDRTKSEERHKGQVMRYIGAMEDIFKKKTIGTLFYLREDNEHRFWDKDGNVVEL